VYTVPAQPVSNTDVVVWYYGGAHHLVRDEDGKIVNGVWQGEAHIMWTGFMLKPHNLFDKTPLYP
jgi:Cu2+-containing amine oxidase